MASYQEDIASKLLHSSDARIAEAAKRVFSSSLPPAVAASLAALSAAAAPLPPPLLPSVASGVLEESAIYKHGDIAYARNIADRAEQYYHTNSCETGNGASVGQDEVSDDYEEYDKKPSSTERLKRR